MSDSVTVNESEQQQVEAIITEPNFAAVVA